jgi:hypothetical protein
LKRVRLKFNLIEFQQEQSKHSCLFNFLQLCEIRNFH